MKKILKKLAGGLVIRRGDASDAQHLADFNAGIHGDNPQDAERVAVWTRDLCSGHPTFPAEDFTIVEDSHTGKIISSLNLISQTWSYAGIPFKMGRPELVGTAPDYRNRGLVRQQFEIIHEWSRQRGEMVQGITGIPYYYRIFGYEMAVDLGGGRSGYSVHVPKLEKDQPEPFRMRKATEADIPFISQCYNAGCQRSLLSAIWELPIWKYQLTGMAPQNVNRLEWLIIETPAGEAVGYLAHPFFLWTPSLACTSFELKAGASWLEVTPSVVRYLWQAGEEVAKVENLEHASFTFSLHEKHPVYEVFGENLPRVRPPYTWYLRVPDLPGFLRHVAPALEHNLENSACHGYSGEFTLGFYRSGIKLAFQSGKLTGVEPWQPQPKDFGKASFPTLTFLQLLFGHRTLDELMYAFPDCTCGLELRPILRALFPKHPSDILFIS